MRYSVAEIEQQLIETLNVNSTFSGVTIRAHAGEVSPATFLTPEALQDIIALAPFVFIQYQGRQAVATDATRQNYVHELVFRFHVGTKDVWNRSEARTEAYTYLAKIYDLIHGKWLGQSYHGIASNLSKLTGKTITEIATGSSPRLTVASHGKAVDDLIHVSGAGGVTGINNDTSNPTHRIDEIVDENSFTIDISPGDSSGAYTGGGTIISAMTSTTLNEQSPFMELGGQDERIIVMMPEILVYQTDYAVRLLA